MIFLYETRNLKTGKIYVGVHNGDPNDSYLGSGVLLTRAIKKYGKQEFSRIILEVFDNEEDAYLRERQIVNEQFIARDDTYNVMLGGVGGWKHVDLRGDKNPMRRAEVAKKVAEGVSRSYTPERRKQNADRMRLLVTSLEIPPRLGKKLTDQQKLKISVKNRGKEPYNKGKTLGPESAEIREKKRAAARRRIEAGFDMGSLGRGKTYNMKQKVCPHCGKIGSGGNMTRFHYDNCKHRKSNC